MNRRRFLKYAGATAAVVGASALGLDYLSSPQPRIPNATSSSTSSSRSTYTSSSYASTSVVKSTSSTLPLSTLSDLDDPKSGYPELANELRKLPEFHQETQESKMAVQRIATLALQSDDAEVRQAFRLILRGGESSQLSYGFLNWNTELQALFWLAEQFELGRNDTLAQAIAIVNGLWIAIGDNEVRKAVQSDIASLLSYLRDLNQFQNNSGYPQLEDYPLKAKLLLGWTGNTTQVFGPYPLIGYRSLPMHLDGYKWNTVEIDTLRKIREFITKLGWSQSDVNELAYEVEDYFRYLGDHWDYVTIGDRKAARITIDGESVWNYHIGNVDFQFNRLIDHGRIIGDCVDQSSIVDSFLKACGIPTTFIQKWRLPADAHMNVLYYDHGTQGIRGIPFQLNSVGILGGVPPDYAVYFPPIRERGYLDLFRLNSTDLVWYNTGFSVPKDLTSLQFFEELTGTGVPIQLMGSMDSQWQWMQES